MDNAIYRLFEEVLNKELIGIIISNSSDRERISKIKIRPVLLKGALCFQASEYIGVKIYHSNYRKEELLLKLEDWFEGLFHQAEISTKEGNATLLISKRGKVTIRKKKAGRNTSAGEVNNQQEENPPQVEGNPSQSEGNPSQSEGNPPQSEGNPPQSEGNPPQSEGNPPQREDWLLHNKKKNYILQEGTPLPFLVDLGVMTKEGRIVKAKTDKFRQINRFLEYIEDILPYLEKGRELTILDFGCGKSYLTFAMYYYLKLLKGYQINIIGLDLKADVIAHCNLLSKKYGYGKLHFLEGDIASYTGSSSIDMVVTLHACDTATDHALYKAVTWDAKVILSVPCCQHELNKQIRSDILKPVLKHGIIKERMSALITDALRAEILEKQGYRVQLLEFIDIEHTPKNILIRAVKGTGTQQSREELESCMEFLGVSPCLNRLLQDRGQL